MPICCAHLSGGSTLKGRLPFLPATRLLCTYSSSYDRFHRVSFLPWFGRPSPPPPHPSGGTFLHSPRSVFLVVRLSSFPDGRGKSPPALPRLFFRVFRVSGGDTPTCPVRLRDRNWDSLCPRPYVPPVVSDRVIGSTFDTSGPGRGHSPHSQTQDPHKVSLPVLYNDYPTTPTPLQSGRSSLQTLPFSATSLPVSRSQNRPVPTSTLVLGVAIGTGSGVLYSGNTVYPETSILIQYLEL